MTDTTNINKSENIKKIIIGVLALIAVVLVILAMLKPKPVIKSNDLSNTTVTAKKENLDDKFSLAFKKASAKLSTPLISRASSKHVAGIHTIPAAPAPKVLPVAKAVTCGHMDHAIDIKIENWKKLFTKESIEHKIGNALPQSVKNRLTGIQNKKQLVIAVMSYFDTNSLVKSAYAKEIAIIKSNYNDENAIKTQLLAISASLVMDKTHKNVPISILNFLVATFQGTGLSGQPLGWDTISEQAKAKGILLPMDYAKSNCNNSVKHVSTSSTVNTVPGNTNNSNNNITNNTSNNNSQLDKTKLYCDDELESRIGNWIQLFTKESLAKAGLDKELPADIVNKLTNVENKRMLVNVIIDFLQSKPNLKSFGDAVLAAGNDETKIQGALLGAVGSLMASYPNTVPFLTAALMGANTGWDNIKIEFKAKGIDLPIDFKFKTEVCKQPKLPDNLHQKIVDWRNQFELSNLTKANLNKELPADIITELTQVKNKKMLVNVIINFLQSKPNLKSFGDAVLAAGDDETKIQSALLGAVGSLMASYPNTVPFLATALMGANTGWDNLKIEFKNQGFELPINYAK